MKSCLSILLAVVAGVTAIPSQAEAREGRRDLSRSHYEHHDYDHHDWDHHHRYGYHRNYRRVYHRGHYEWRHHHRIWIPARTVVVYF